MTIDTKLYIYRVEVVRVQEVPEFGPPLPEIAIFDTKEKLSHFLLAKRKLLYSDSSHIQTHISFYISGECRICSIKITKVLDTNGTSPRRHY